MTDTIPQNKQIETPFIKTVYDDLIKLITTNSNFIKRFSISMMIAIAGSIFAFSLAVAGLRVLIEAGVPELTLLKAVGVGLILLSIMSLKSASRLINRILWRSEKKELKE